MSNEIDEDLKIAIAKKYEEMQKSENIKNAADELGVSEATFHKYKKHKPIEKIKEENNEEENEEENNEDFEKKFIPDDDDDDDDDVTIEELIVE